MKIFRADKRRFVIGQTIVTAREFPSLNPQGIQLETVFATTQPESKPARGESLFVFESFDDAEWHWAKMRGGIFYECEISDDAVLHRGDMRYVDLAGEEIRAGRDPSLYTQQYWAGDSSDAPRWELLVRNAVVTKLICDDQQLRIARAIYGQRLPRDGAPVS